MFVAHTTEAWEFNEPDFFQVTGTGGTVASTGLLKVREIIDARFNPARSNIYLFYASDGDNSVSDAAEARAALASVAADTCFTGYVEVSSGLLAPARHRDRQAVRRALRGRLCRRQLRAQRFRRRVGRGAALLHGGEQRARRSGAAAHRQPMSDDWRSYIQRIEQLAARSGLVFNPVDFEAVPDSFMMEIAVYGLPVRMPHWSFGVRYIYQLIQRRMGHSRLFEVVFPGNPGHAYLADEQRAG